MNPKPWTSKEMQIVKAYANSGAEAIAELTGRTTNAVRQYAHKHRISLRPASETRGKIMGETRDGSLSSNGLNELRNDLLNGSLKPARLQEHLKATAATLRGEQRELCPSCTTNPVERLDTGLCRTCHYRALTEAYRNANAERNAERELVRERQRRHRAQQDDVTKTQQGEQN